MAALKRINQDDLRNHNLSVVLNTMLRSTSAFSRADLAKETGLTKATMSLLISMLIEHRIVKEGAPLVQSVYGRPSTPLSIAGGSVCGIGIQINTDGYGYVVLDLDGSVVAERWIARDLHDADADALFGELDAMLSEQERTLHAQNYMIAGVGLALPGLVTEDGHLLMARNLGWEDLDLSRFDLIRHFDVTVANESNMAAVAQLPGYATQRTDEGIVGPNGSFLYVSTDIGIGGAIVRAGRVVTGDHGFAGEIGHLSVQMDGPVCRCGRRGCVEAYAGRRSMVEAAGVATGNDAASLEAIDEFTRRVEAGDPVATAVFADAGHAMTSMLTSVINLADLDTVIIGGNWARVPADMLARMAARIQDRILARGTLNVRLLRASGVSRPALFGAAQTGLRDFIDNPLRYLN
ncbi:NagC family transcriptional regulator [Bifidobacterium pseudolongum subsp. globosum]|uniref:NagC family transcriptional regulator n=1 Tax=Bifidobacterium pseudolongum subsp. globosum TaxID=1690 RepID=A0A4Q5A0U2_9BIFI|nr:ROK family transcriptional regulator [Bifidobacterium pseudolongum]RYQ10952.1 NagC family transcriptional regulator [Bifidobacterium pseudolongum subsp. globosum]